MGLKGHRSTATLLITAVIASIILLLIVINKEKTSLQATLPDKETIAVPVAVAQIRKSAISLTRSFSGTLEAESQFLVAPKISGRVARLHVDISDTVRRGQVVAELDNEEYIQEVALAKADLAVARANLEEAHNALIIANRELKRTETLNTKGITSEAQLDIAKSSQLEKETRFEVARAQVMRAEAILETANIRHSYTTIKAEWHDGDQSRVVAERFVDEGNTVSANTPLMSIVKLHPITGLFFVTEKEYSKLNPGQTVELVTDAFPDRTFEGTISRIAPVFKQETRQARVEITIDNLEQMLKPGIFIRTTVVLDHLENATVIPEQALSKRDDQTGVFVIDEKEETVQWVRVNVGIKEGNYVQVKTDDLEKTSGANKTLGTDRADMTKEMESSENPELAGVKPKGKVVILGQQLLKDGSRIVIVE
ncbi:efflux RND transporter periplasmic adaptor subunit [Desulfamplus magnetovallimortis]|nr:efflux RND transporter periplasmic adaptor subunit [Desulfamplus magnetovallimortis]